jgi:cytochrome c2
LADFKDERAYDSKLLTKIFLWSSLTLLVCVVIMALKDYNRPWKEYQRKFMRMERKDAIAKKKEAASAIDQAQLAQLQGELKDAEKEVKTHRKEMSKLESKAASLNAKIYKLTQDYQMKKAEIDAAKFDYSEHYLKENKKNTKFGKKIQKMIADANAMNQELFELDKSLKAIYAQQAEIQKTQDEVLAKMKVLTKDRDLLALKAENLKQGFLFKFRNAMLLDFMSPTIQIKQVILNNLPEDMYFTKTVRVDRCMTCHLTIDQKGYEDKAQPFRTHPHLERYVGSSSPHPMDKVGCTTCHGGVGPAVDFNGCAHMPNSEEQAKKWKKSKKLKWHEPEGVDRPMLPLKYTEGSCLKCHGLQEHVNFAPKLNRGRELMVTRGCVGCHKVKNLEDMPKAGPALIRIKGKLKRDFVEKWVWSPTSFNPHARMPNFFQQTNNGEEHPENFEKTKAELKAVVDYLFEHSADYNPPEAPGGGSVANGKKLFKTIGCMACHGIEDVTSYHADFAPDLSGTGSKLSAPWVYSWIRNPRHFDPDTRMPSLRLSNQEASDITAYLMSKRNKDFEQLAAPEAKADVRDGLIVDYLRPQVGEKTALEQLAQMDEKKRDEFLGQKTMNKYGCFGCHTIQGFEKAPGIGAELSEWGTKRVNQLDFGFIEMEHSHETFINAKLENPRQFDKDKVLAFQDLLKMPNFHLNEEEREAIATAVLGLTKTYVPDEMIAGIHGNGPLLEKGRRVINEFNCRGCHMIEAEGKSVDAMLKHGQGGRILEMYKNEGLDYAVGPPNLNKIGARTRADWLHDFFLDVKPIRRNLSIRMPSFHWTDERMSDVLNYMNLLEGQVYPYKSFKTKSLSGSDYAEAKALFNKLQCQKCHVVGGRMPADPNSTAPDLMKVKGRLKPEWVVQWLRNPDALSPGTPMLSFWPDGVPMEKGFFHGDDLKQREMLRDYLFMMGSGGGEGEESSSSDKKNNKKKK